MNICDIKKLAAQGMSRVDIAKHLKICRYPLNQICLKHNIKTVGKDNRIPMNELVDALTKDLSFVVAFNYGITTSELRRRFKYNNMLVDDISIRDDDILNTLGYDVLHVLHSDYIKDPQSILDRCIEFLGVNDVN